MSKSLMQGVLTPFDYQMVEAVNKDLDVELKEPRNPQPYVKQQFGIYLRIGTHLGDVMSDERYFTYTELRDKVRAILDAWMATTFEQKPDSKSLISTREKINDSDISPNSHSRRRRK